MGDRRLHDNLGSCYPTAGSLPIAPTWAPGSLVPTLASCPGKAPVPPFPVLLSSSVTSEEQRAVGMLESVQVVWLPRPQLKSCAPAWFLALISGASRALQKQCVPDKAKPGRSTLCSALWLMLYPPGAWAPTASPSSGEEQGRLWTYVPTVVSRPCMSHFPVPTLQDDSRCRSGTRFWPLESIPSLPQAGLGLHLGNHLPPRPTAPSGWKGKSGPAHPGEAAGIPGGADC